MPALKRSAKKIAALERYLQSMNAFRNIELLVFAFCIPQAGAQDTLKVIEQLAEADPKPFVIVEGSGKASKSRAQGVVVSTKGHVLSVGHIAWINADKAFTDDFRISFRGTGRGLPSDPAHIHKTVFSDREDATYFEHYFPASLQKQGGSRFIAASDLAIFRIGVDEGSFPKVEFFSKTKPALTAGDNLHLCHFTFPHKPGDPFFLMNPVEVVGVAQTSSGIQYLAKGYYRVGSSGGAILKDGRLIGIQSSAYTVNAKDVGEIPLGLISFELVWSDLIADVLEPPADGANDKAEQGGAGQPAIRSESEPEGSDKHQPESEGRSR